MFLSPGRIRTSLPDGEFETDIPSLVAGGGDSNSHSRLLWRA